MIPSTASIVGYGRATGGGGGGGGGGGSFAASITSRTVSKSDNSGLATISAVYKVDSDGNIYNHNNTLLESWLDTGTNADFEVRATLSSGDSISTGTMGTWLATTSDRSWFLTAAPGETKQSLVLFEIRTAVSHTVLTSATITLNATSSGGGP